MAKPLTWKSCKIEKRILRYLFIIQHCFLPVLIPTKAGTYSDLVPGSDSEAKPVSLGAQRRGRRYGA